MLNEGSTIMFRPSYDLEKIRHLEATLIKYVERYGLTDAARDALVQLEEIQVPRPNIES